MKKNGFISTTIIYTFFIVFLMMLLFVINSYASNRNLIRTLKNDVKNDISDSYLSRYLINHKDENPNLVYHNETLTNGAKDYSYRFVGTNPSNYICLGSNANPCPMTNLYRIIGIIEGKIKIIKYTSLGNMQWNNFASSSWANSSLIKYLNETFYNSLGTSKDLISNMPWYVLGLATNNVFSKKASDIYQVEVGPLKGLQNAVTKHIGLLYINEYAYATTNANWTKALNMYANTDVKNNNWLASFNDTMWLQTPLYAATDQGQAYFITNTGAINNTTVTTSYQIRPTMYLKPTVKITSGEGTYASPYRIG